MFRGIRWLALAGVVTTAALVGPSAAFACDGSGSATSIYTECTPTASGKPHHPPARKPSPPSVGSQSPPPTYYVKPTPPVHVSHKTQRTVARSGKDKRFLNRLVSNPNYIDSRSLKPELTSSPRASSLSSTFDLGSGPLILLALLAGSVLSVLGAGGVRAWRGRHRI